MNTNNAMKKLTLKAATSTVRNFGFSLKKIDGEYILKNPKNGSTYYTDDIEDVVKTAETWAKSTSTTNNTSTTNTDTIIHERCRGQILGQMVHVYTKDDKIILSAIDGEEFVTHTDWITAACDARYISERYSTRVRGAIASHLQRIATSSPERAKLVREVLGAEIVDQSSAFVKNLYWELRIHNNNVAPSWSYKEIDGKTVIIRDHYKMSQRYWDDQGKEWRRGCEPDPDRPGVIKYVWEEV